MDQYIMRCLDCATQSLYYVLSLLFSFSLLLVLQHGIIWHCSQCFRIGAKPHQPTAISLPRVWLSKSDQLTCARLVLGHIMCLFIAFSCTDSDFS
jgi:hypothetical protein